jgi:hypothetical protein
LRRGRAIARGALTAFKLFSLGMGGGLNCMWTTVLAAAGCSLWCRRSASSRSRPCVRRDIYVAIAAVALAPRRRGCLPSLLAAGVAMTAESFSVMHLAIGGLFLHFMTLPDRSVTLRILVELLLASEHQLSVLSRPAAMVCGS